MKPSWYHLAWGTKPVPVEVGGWVGGGVVGEEGLGEADGERSERQGGGLERRFSR